MRIVGIDPSLTGTGIAIIEGGQVTVRTVKSKGAAGDSLAARRFRLARLVRDIEEIVYPHVDLIVIEAPAYNSRTGHQHDRSGLWWLLVERALGNYVHVAEVTTGGVKRYATGKGNAGKDSVLLAVARRFPDVAVTDNNQADALILAAMGARHLGQPIDSMPQAHCAALESVRWPEVRA